MPDFIHNLINRHNDSAAGIKPYLKSKFEPVSVYPDTYEESLLPHHEYLQQEGKQPDAGDAFLFPKKKDVTSESNEFLPGKKIPAKQDAGSIHFANKSVEEYRTGENAPGVVKEKQLYNLSDQHHERIEKIETRAVISQLNDRSLPETTESKEHIVTNKSNNRSANQPLMLVHDNTDKASPSEETTGNMRTVAKELNSQNTGSGIAFIAGNPEKDIGVMKQTDRRETKYINSNKQTETDDYGQLQYESQPDQPAIRVTIGRVEIKAVMQPAYSAPVKSISSVKPQMSLDDYVKQRNNKH